MLVNDVLQNKRLMDGAVIRPVGYLSKRPHVMLLSVVLCEVNQALNQDASIQPAEPRRSSPTAIGLELAVYVASPFLKMGVTNEVFHDQAEWSANRPMMCIRSAGM